MSQIHYNFMSKSLGIRTAVYVNLPEPLLYKKGMYPTLCKKKLPVLYLLHGQSDDYTAWQRYTSIERYAVDKGIAVVMPAVNRSFYLNLSNGYKYFDFITEELPYIMEELLPISGERDDRFVAGLSMGGYGALLIGLTLPERYAAVASLSGCLNVAEFKLNSDLFPGEFKSIFPNSELKDSEYDLYKLIKNLSVTSKAPKFYQCCGTEDDLLKQNRDFYNFASKLNVDFTYEEETGVHDWAYWDKKIQDVLNWLPIRKET